jgi:mannose-6-phosphate isomerase-like protein (cupin superfamily)
MMQDNNIQEQLQDYCLGLLGAAEIEKLDTLIAANPQLSEEVKAYQLALENYAMLQAVTPSAGIKNKIDTLITNLGLEANFTLDNTPVINEYSDYRNWLKVVQPLIPAVLEEDVFTKVIRDDGKITQTLIKSRVNYPDEVHGELHESFIVLEGECECYIGEEVVRLGPGGFINIPLHKHHDVKVLTPYVVAIQQRIAV